MAILSWACSVVSGIILGAGFTISLSTVPGLNTEIGGLLGPWRANNVFTPSMSPLSTASGMVLPCAIAARFPLVLVTSGVEIDSSFFFLSLNNPLSIGLIPAAVFSPISSSTLSALSPPGF